MNSRGREVIMGDIRYGLRMLAKHPGFTFIAALTLALGIGATTAIFSIVNAVVIRPLPYPESEKLVVVGWQLREGIAPMVTVTNNQYAFWKENSTSFVEAAAYTDVARGVNISGGDQPLRVRGLRASDGLFRVLGVSLPRGRSFTADEDSPDGPSVVIFSDGLWRGYFGADPAIIGKAVEVNGKSHTVVGVLPADFQFESPIDLVVPMQIKLNPKDQGHNTTMVARLKPGTGIESAQAEVDRYLPAFREAVPGHIGPNEMGARLIAYRDYIVGDVSSTLMLLFGAVGLVLLIACVNVANLLLARASSRNAEMAIRTALGAGRFRLVRQMLTESLLLAVVGGGAGVLVALWGVPALMSINPGNLPRTGEINVDYQAVIFALAVSFITSALFGILPALRAARLDINETLKASSNRSGTGRLDKRLRGLLVVSEVALAVVLLVGAALLIKSFSQLRAVEVGFNPENLTTMQVSLTSDTYKTTDRAWAFQQQVLERISAHPGVVSAATSVSQPLQRGLNTYIDVVVGGEERGRSVECRPISPTYFSTIGMKVLHGRAFNDADGAGSTPVIILNETLARLLWRDQVPMGEQVRVGGKSWQVVGISSDINDQGLDQKVAPTIYMPMAQVADSLNAAMNRWFLTTWLVRTSGPVDLAAMLRNAVREVDPQIPVATIQQLTDVMSRSISSRRFTMTLMGIFAALALALTVIGIYGVLSYHVSQRTHEIGIRMALGAEARDVLKLVVGHALALAAVGVLIGLVGAYALSGLMKSMVFNVSVTDPAAFIAIPIVVIAAALFASYIPARRAMKVDPMVALRYE
jgi:predicted permease